MLDMKIIDFQLCRISSVVSDLSYLIYSGASKAILGNLEYYLKIYHKTFSNTLRKFNLEPEKIFTFENLKEEWKAHCKFGFIFGQVTWRSKLQNNYEKRNLSELNEEKIEILGDANQLFNHKYKDEFSEIKEVCLGIIEHLHNNDYL